VESYRQLFFLTESSSRRERDTPEIKSDLSSSPIDDSNAALLSESALLINAKKIYETYISHEVMNLPSAVTSDLHLWYNKVTSNDPIVSNNASNPQILQSLFTSAQIEIFKLLRADSLVRFHRTEEFAKIIAHWNAISLLVGDSKEQLSRTPPLSEGDQSPVPSPNSRVELIFPSPIPSPPSGVEMVFPTQNVDTSVI